MRAINKLRAAVLAAVGAVLLVTVATAHAQTLTDPKTGLPWCHQPGYLPVPWGPTVGMITSLSNPNNGDQAVIEPGAWVFVRGLQFNYLSSQVATADAGSGPLPTVLGGTTILIDGCPARIAFMGLDFGKMPFPSTALIQVGQTAGRDTAEVKLQMTLPDGTACVTPSRFQPATAATSAPTPTASNATRTAPRMRVPRLINRGGGFYTLYGVGNEASIVEADGAVVQVTFADEREITFQTSDGDGVSRLSVNGKMVAPAAQK